MTRFSRSVPFLLLLILLPQLGRRGLNEPDEGRHVETAREMIATGDWLTPRVKDVPHWAKPPLTAWVVGLSLEVFGLDETGARMPSLLAAWLTTLATLAVATRCFDRPTGVLAAFLLATMLFFFAMSRIVMPDMMLAAATAGAFDFYLAARERHPRRGLRRLALWCCLGISFLAKGPIGWMIFFSALAAASALERSLDPWRGIGATWGLPLMLVVGLSWHLIQCFRDPSLVGHFVGAELVDRVSDVRERAKPFWFLFVMFPLAALPWTPFAILGLRRAHPEARRFLLCWILPAFAVFTASQSKQWYYVLPLLPPVATLAAGALRNRRVLGRLVPVAALALHAILFLVPAHEEELGNSSSHRRLALAVLEREAKSGGPGLVGAELRSPFQPIADQPDFPAEGTIVVSFRLRFLAAAFYLLRDRAEYIPIYDGGSLWERREDREKERRLSDEDLSIMLHQERRVIVLARSRDLDDLAGLFGATTRIIARAGAGRDEVVALTNR